MTGYGVELITDRVAEIEPGFVVRLAGGRVLHARRILLATGVTDELPDIPGVRERWGRDLLHCPYCHGWEVRDQPLGVLGTLPGSVQHALLVRQWSDDVVFFVNTYDLGAAERAQLEARGVQVVPGAVARLVVDADRLTGVELADGTVIARTAVFVRPGNVPHADGLLQALGCEVNEAGFAIVDGTGRTSTVGVWAAGNVVDPRAQVITAAGAGSAAAIADQRRPRTGRRRAGSGNQSFAVVRTRSLANEPARATTRPSDCRRQRPRPTRSRVVASNRRLSVAAVVRPVSSTGACHGRARAWSSPRARRTGTRPRRAP